MIKAHDGDYKYTGMAILETLKEAKRYNAYLMSQILKYRNDAQSVLDFGAGIGTFMDIFEDIDIIAVERDPILYDLLKKKGYRVYTDLSEIDDNSIEFIYTLNVLEHIKDDKSALKELYSKLKPGGKLFIYVPALKILFSNLDRKIKHYRRYKKTQTIHLLQGIGYNIVIVKYVDSLGFIAALLYKILNKSGDLSLRSIKMYDTFLFPLSRRLDDLGFKKLFGKNLLIIANRPIEAKELR